MNVTAPSKPAVILAAPINVEESRAQRLQRQQARFRDRGGIFVPTNRSTLANILLGKASPLKKPRRSASASPSRAKSTDNEVSKPALRRSPRKQSQKKIDVEEQPTAITDDPESEVSKPIRKATSFKSSKSHPQNDLAYKPTKKSSTKKVFEDEFACKPAKKSTKGSAVEKGKSKSLEDHSLAKEDTLSSESTSKAVAASSKGKKRTNVSIAQDSDSQLRRKLIKSGDVDPSLHKNSNLSKAPLITSKKRRRNPKDTESDVEDGTDKGTKRKKSESRESPEINVEEVSVKPVGKRPRKVAKSTRKGKKIDDSTTTSYSPSENRESPEINVEEDSVKPIAKRTRKVTKSTRKSQKQSSDNSTTTKRKENAPVSKPSKKVASKTGPPKSVLQRIKNSLGTQVVDNEPDPIDFLS